MRKCVSLVMVIRTVLPAMVRGIVLTVAAPVKSIASCAGEQTSAVSVWEPNTMRMETDAASAAERVPARGMIAKKDTKTVHFVMAESPATSAMGKMYAPLVMARVAILRIPQEG